MYNISIAYLLWFFSGCGILGFHRFYLGKYRTGILWMCTLGFGFIGAIYDFFTLPRQVWEANVREAVFNSPHKRRHENPFQYENAGDRIPPQKESVERTILKLAKANGGILTPGELALKANIPIENAKRNLDALVSKGFAEIRVRKTGVLVYTLPEFMNSGEPLEDF